MGSGSLMNPSARTASKGKKKEEKRSNYRTTAAASSVNHLTTWAEVGTLLPPVPAGLSAFNNH